MPQFPVSDQQAIVDGLNYLLSGPGNLGQSFQGYSSNVSTALTGDIVDPTTGQISSGLPYVTGYLQYYLTDCQARVGVQGGQDRVVLSAQLNLDFNYTAVATSGIQYTVALNRYRAYPNTSTNYNDYLFFEQNTIASHVYNLSLPTSSAGLYAVTASGTKIAYTAPATGSLIYPVNYVATAVNATTGTGLNANIQIQIAYGAAGTYNDTNTKITVMSPGSDWAIGDTIVIDGADVGGVTGVNDLTLTVTQVSFGAGPTVSQETIFTGVIDKPTIGFYLYAIEVQWYALSGAITIDNADMKVRSITTQVVKQ